MSYLFPSKAHTLFRYATRTWGAWTDSNRHMPPSQGGTLAYYDTNPMVHDSGLEPLLTTLSGSRHQPDSQSCVENTTRKHSPAYPRQISPIHPLYFKRPSLVFSVLSEGFEPPTKALRAPCSDQAELRKHYELYAIRARSNKAMIPSIASLSIKPMVAFPISISPR